MTSCTICPRPLAPDTDLVVCWGCASRLRAGFRELARQLPLLQQLLTPGGGPPRRGGTGRAHSPLPARLDVLNLLGPGQVLLGPDQDDVPIGPILHAWARSIANSYPTVTRDVHGTVHVQQGYARPAVRRADLAGWCAWLVAYAPWACTQPWAATLYEQQQQLLARLRAKTGDGPTRTLRNAPCPECDGFALVTLNGEDGTECEACGANLTAEEYAQHSGAVLPALTAIAVRIALQQAADAAA
ncbi:hypothetical protein AB0J25_11975 [Streptomyces sp. NPDC049910]|uniref:hypothetical protein n=1 Tax=Streptomyces sp. NPDC049910 TaxID=3155278 RepID=UPI0034319710